MSPSNPAGRLARATFCILLCIGGVSVALGQLPTLDPARAWNTTAKQTFQASVVSFDGTTVTLRMPNGSKIETSASALSGEDQSYLTAWRKRQPIKIAMPDVVKVEAAQINTVVVSEDAAAEKFLYRTPHFEFESQGKFNQSLLREVARNFEATHALLKVLPWGIEPKPASGAFFRAQLLKDREAYMAAGGLPGSGGVYKSDDQLFMVPFESIGVKQVGKSYAKDDNFETHALVHELTHQLMHFWLGLLPQWVVEGTAEYVATLPLRAGSFRLSAAKTGLKDHVEFLKRNSGNRVPQPYPLESLFLMTNAQWNAVLAKDPQASQRLYFTSYLLVYYFMHLDNQGDGQLFARYFREVGEAVEEVDAYGKAIEAFKKQPGVEVAPDGSFTYRADLKLPTPPAFAGSPETRLEFQKRTLQILLDGRTEAELMKQIRSAYTKLGIRL